MHPAPTRKSIASNSDCGISTNTSVDLHHHPPPPSSSSSHHHPHQSLSYANSSTAQPSSTSSNGLSMRQSSIASSPTAAANRQSSQLSSSQRLQQLSMVDGGAACDSGSTSLNVGPSASPPTDQVLVSLHHLCNLPKTMQMLDPNRTQLELVVQATAKYYLIQQPGQPPVPQSSVARLELTPLTVTFSPSSILYRKEKFVLDMDTLRPTTSSTTLGNSVRDRVSSSSNATTTSSLPPNQILWQFPSPPTTTCTLELFVGMKERRVGSSTSHWIASGSSSGAGAAGAGNGGGSSEQQGVKFLVPCENIFQQKLLTKFVGLSVGQVALSFTVSPSDTANGIQRLTQLVLKKQLASTVSTAQMLATETLHQCGGELAAHSALLKKAQPDVYRRRAEKLLQLYQQDPSRVEELLKEYEGREEILLRTLALDIGPELCSVGPKHRLAAFMKKFKLSDSQIATVLQEKGFTYTSSLVETETEAVFEALSQQFGNEPRPTSYLFPPVAYEPDRRIFVMENMFFPVNKANGKNWRDVALAARQKRVPFTSSPLEREQSRTSRSGRQLSEIEILQEKHEPEFKQIIPSIAEALSNVLVQHTQLARNAPRDDRFALYETNNVPGIQFDDYVHRIAEYTYISPATMVAAVIFLDRLCEKYPSLLLTERNIFKLFFVAVRVASKVVDLRSLNNKNFASVGGVGNKHLNDLEETFLKHLRFDFFLSPTEFFEYGKRLHPSSVHSQIPRHFSNAGNGANNNQQQLM